MCSSAPTCVLRGQQEIATISADIPAPDPFFPGEGGGGEGRAPPPASRCCPLPAITRSHAITEESPPVPPPAPSSKRSSSGWKTSKFFSRTMSSGEILRGLKKLSLTSSADDPPPQDAPRPRKSKSGQQLKKRASAGNDDDDPKARSPRSPGSFRPLSKAMSVSEPGSSSRSASSLGIVCRKEDLKAILCTAGKKFPLASPSSMRRRNPASPLRHTKSASFETHDGSRKNPKEPVRRSGSEEAARGRRTTPLLRPPPLSTCENDEKKKQSPPPPSTVDEQKTKKVTVVGTMEGDEGESVVKWDECEVVDAVVLGDAIESFLKGSMGGRAASFKKKTPVDRRAKSDG